MEIIIISQLKPNLEISNSLITKFYTQEEISAKIIGLEFIVLMFGEVQFNPYNHVQDITIKLLINSLLNSILNHNMSQELGLVYSEYQALNGIVIMSEIEHHYYKCIQVLSDSIWQLDQIKIINLLFSQFLSSELIKNIK